MSPPSGSRNWRLRRRSGPGRRARASSSPTGLERRSAAWAHRRKSPRSSRSSPRNARRSSRGRRFSPTEDDPARCSRQRRVARPAGSGEGGGGGGGKEGGAGRVGGGGGNGGGGGVWGGQERRTNDGDVRSDALSFFPPHLTPPPPARFFPLPTHP